MILGQGGMIDSVEGARFEIETERLRLRPWHSSDADDLALMSADIDVMADLGGPLPRAVSDRKIERFQRSFRDDRITRWVVTDHDGCFLGYCGIVVQGADHPLGVHNEIGWRLVRDAWGYGYATEAASAALADAFARLGCPEVLAYTASDNVRSQAVMVRLGLQRRPWLDFAHHYENYGLWTGLVWAATRPGGESQ
jgi:RimJ/RimL family protein N-acetyltransferase